MTNKSIYSTSNFRNPQLTSGENFVLNPTKAKLRVESQANLLQARMSGQHSPKKMIPGNYLAYRDVANYFIEFSKCIDQAFDKKPITNIRN